MLLSINKGIGGVIPPILTKAYHEFLSVHMLRVPKAVQSHTDLGRYEMKRSVKSGFESL